MVLRWRPTLRFLAFVVLALAACSLFRAACRYPPARPGGPAAGVDPAYASTIEPIFNRRCVPCHACFDSPCQVNLQAFEGLDRGGNKTVVYHPNRLFAEQPTRLFEDATTTPQWRAAPFGFFPVIDRAGDRDPERSILWRFVEQRAKSPGGTSFNVDTVATCPATVAETDTELRLHPERGMPFGFPALTASDTDAIVGWIRRGSGGPGPAATEEGPVARAIATWETFFNRPDDRSRLVSAYLFEHLFYAHLYFDVAPGAWFRLVRSRKAAGDVIAEIATRRPYDDPGEDFVYRLRRIHTAIVEKTHAPYALSDRKLERLQQLFGGAWPVTKSNPFDPKVAANPFVAFAAIPARARYQFLLDDARYHVQTFIHGPVCRGQAALDVIDEHFFIFFMSPDSDPAVTDAAYLAQAAPFLSVPADDGGTIEEVHDALVVRHADIDGKYLALQSTRLSGRTLADVWDGDGTNRHAVLTVYRHFDNAFVLDGAIGGMPKTAWVLDYPLFERMYYDLVAGFDVYGNVVHQVGTRLYQNLLRIEAEGQLLRFLPADPPGVREKVLESWYRGRVARALAGVHAAAFAGPGPQIRYANLGRPKDELITRLLTQRLPPAVVGARDAIGWPDLPLPGDASRARFEDAMRGIVNRPASTAPFVSAFPDATLLRVKTMKGDDLVYTIIRNRGHLSVEFIWPEGVELEPQEDMLHVVPGIATSRPNLLLATTETELDTFVSRLTAIQAGGAGAPDPSWSTFVAAYGARRSDPNFWRAFDFFGDVFPKIDPVGAGILDLSRYGSD
jgi:hypothetical protein